MPEKGNVAHAETLLQRLPLYNDLHRQPHCAPTRQQQAGAWGWLCSAPRCHSKPPVFPLLQQFTELQGRWTILHTYLKAYQKQPGTGDTTEKKATCYIKKKVTFGYLCSPNENPSAMPLSLPSRHPRASAEAYGRPILAGWDTQLYRAPRHFAEGSVWKETCRFQETLECFPSCLAAPLQASPVRNPVCLLHGSLQNGGKCLQQEQNACHSPSWSFVKCANSPTACRFGNQKPREYILIVLGSGLEPIPLMSKINLDRLVGEERKEDIQGKRGRKRCVHACAHTPLSTGRGCPKNTYNVRNPFKASVYSDKMDLKCGPRPPIVVQLCCSKLEMIIQQCFVLFLLNLTVKKKKRHQCSRPCGV